MQSKLFLRILIKSNRFNRFFFLHNSKSKKEDEKKENKHGRYSLSANLCKALFFSKQKQDVLMPIASIKIGLQNLIDNYIELFDVSKEEQEKEKQIKKVVDLIMNQNLQKSSKSEMPLESGKIRNSRLKIIRSHTSDQLIINTKQDGQRINSLILSIKIDLNHSIRLKSPDHPIQSQMTNINVHVNRTTTANELLKKILQKVNCFLIVDFQLKYNSNLYVQVKLDEIIENYSVFEVICNHRLERIVMDHEEILPLVLSWSDWPTHWSEGASIEIRPINRLLKGFVDHQTHRTKSSHSHHHNHPHYHHNHHHHHLHHQKNSEWNEVELSSLNVIRFDNEPSNYSPKMLMSIVRYCGPSQQPQQQQSIQSQQQRGNGGIRQVLAEFSSFKLSLFCKETNYLIGQYGLQNIYWYVGIESQNILNNSNNPSNSTQPNSKCSDTFDDGGGEKIKSNKSKNNRLETIGSNRNLRSVHHSIHQKHFVPPSSSIAITDDDDDSTIVPAITFIERNRINTRQISTERRMNCGQTLIFNNCHELNRWIRCLFEATLYNELFTKRPKAKSN